MSEDMISCEEALRLIASYVDRELGAEESSALEKHVLRCRSCFSRVEFEHRLKSQLTTLRSTDVSDALQERIRGLLQHYGT